MQPPEHGVVTWRNQSGNRKEFSMLVAKRATEIVNKIAMDPDWRQIFNSEEDSATSTELRHIISQLRTMPKSGEEYQFLRSLLGAPAARAIAALW